MWKRKTWHECADELDQICQQFRRAHWGIRSRSWPRHPDDVAEMRRCSIEGVSLLRVLALAVRSEQDLGLSNPTNVVGVVKNTNVTLADADEAKRARGYQGLGCEGDYSPLQLRQALNKIAHADPTVADFYVSANNDVHDLLLFGEYQGNKWFAVISILEIIRAIRSLPDAKVAS